MGGQKRWRDLTYDEVASPRAQRARRFAQTVMGILRMFLPNDRACSHRIEDWLLDVGYEANAEIINVPPECDELDKLALERLRLDTTAARVNGMFGEVTEDMVTRALNAWNPDMAKVAPNLGGWSKGIRDQMQRAVKAALGVGLTP